MSRQLMLAVTLVASLALPVWAQTPGALSDVKEVTPVGDGTLAVAAHTAGANPLAAPNYDWWHGCSATSAGMMMGYYDNNGYASLGYTNLVPGGAAEAETYVGPPTGLAALANQVIASGRHIGDFYVSGYGASGDDVSGAPTGPLNCLADFMGTNQDAAGNSNGSTTFYYWHDGTGAPLPYRFTSDDAVTHIAAPGVVQSGMYGVGEYVQYAGYNYVNPTNDPLNLSSPQPVGSRDDWLYNQYIDPYVAGGFSLADFQAEIDAGRPVLVHIEEHTMLGYAYDPNNTNIFVYDTWGDIDGAGPYTDGQNPGVLTWGGYYQGAQHYGVTVLELLGGEQTQYVPEPSSVVLAAFGFLVLALATRRRRLKR